MKFSLFAIAALAAPAAAASRKRKIAKKDGSLTVSYGATGQTDDDVIPIGDFCYDETPGAYDERPCAIPPGLDHGVCLGFDRPRDPISDITWCQTGQPGAICDQTSDCVIPPGLEHGVCREIPNHPGSHFCQSGKSGSSCGDTTECVCGENSECVIPNGLDHGVCRDDYCQDGKSGSSCGETSDCVIPKGLDHAVCRRGKCQRGVQGDYCGQDNDCLSNDCRGLGDTAKCHK